MAITITLPVVGGSADSWGTILNQSLTTVADSLNGVGTDKIAPNLDTLKIDGTVVTSTPVELNLVDGSSAGVTVPTKAVIYDSGGGIVYGSWTIKESGGNLTFSVSGSTKMRLDTSGNLTVSGDVTAFGSP